MYTIFYRYLKNYSSLKVTNNICSVTQITYNDIIIRNTT